MDVTGHALITDFGLATATQKLDCIRSASEDHSHAARWTAPEILTGNGTFSEEADIFSFAMVMVEVCYEWAVFVELWLIVTLYHHRYIPARFRSVISDL